MQTWIDVSTLAGSIVGDGPITSATEWQSEPRMDEAGSFSFSMPAADPRSALLTAKRVVTCYAIVNGAVTEKGSGIVETVDTTVGEPTMLRVTGRDIMGELATVVVGDMAICEQDWTALDGGLGTVRWMRPADPYPSYTELDLGPAYDADTDTWGGTDNPEEEICLISASYTDAEDATYLFVGHDQRFDQAHFYFETYNGQVRELMAQYYNGEGWQDLPIILDGTSQDTGDGYATWSQDGIVYWSRPADWERYTAIGEAGNWFFVRFTLERDPDAGAIATDYVQLAEVKVYADVPTDNAVNLIMANAPATWVQSGYPATGQAVYHQFQGESVLAALKAIAEITGEHFRLLPGREIDWIDAFDDSGLRAVALRDPSLVEGDTETVLITRVRQKRDTSDAYSRVIPKGAGGITLALTDRTPPAGYTLSAGDNYIQRDSAISAWGVIEITQQFTDVSMQQPDSYTIHPIMAANALFDRALEWLSKHSAEESFYDLTIAKLEAELLPGQTIYVSYHEIIDGHHAVTIETALNVLSTRVQIDSSGVYTVGLEVATIDRHPSSDTSTLVGTVLDARRSNLPTVARSVVNQILPQLEEQFAVVDLPAPGYPHGGRATSTVRSAVNWAGGGSRGAKAYGAIGDGNSHPLSDYYASLSAAQADYPHAIALTDELDWCAIQLAINSAGVMGEVYLDGHYVINRPVLLPPNGVDLIGSGVDSARITKTTNTVGATDGRLYRGGTRTDSYAVDYILGIDHLDNTPARRVRIENLTLRSSAATDVGYGLYMPRFAYSTIRRVYVYNCQYGLTAYTSFVNTVEDVTLYNITSRGFNFANDGSGQGVGTSTKIIGCYVNTGRNTATSQAYSLYGLNYSSLISCACDNLGNDTYPATVYRLSQCRGVTLDGCGNENCTGRAFYLTGSRAVVKGHYTAYQDGVTSGTSAYLQMGDPTNGCQVSFEGCYFGAFDTQRNSYNEIIQGGSQVRFINTTEPTGGNTFISYASGSVCERVDDSETITRSGGSVHVRDNTETRMPLVPIKQEATGGLVKWRQGEPKRLTGFTTATALDLIAFECPGGTSGAAYNGMCSGILSVSVAARHTSGYNNQQSKLFFVTIYKRSNSTMTCDIQQIGSTNEEYHGGAALSFTVTERGDTSATVLTLQATVTMADMDSNNSFLYCDFHMHSGGRSSAEMITPVEPVAEVPWVLRVLPDVQAWYTFDDADYLYTDDAMTTLVTTDGDVIGAVADRSGEDRHIIQATAGKKALWKTGIRNGLAVGRFDGVDDFLANAAPGALLKNVGGGTLIAIVSSGALTSGDDVGIVFVSQGDSATATRLRLGRARTADNSVAGGGTRLDADSFQGLDGAAETFTADEWAAQIIRADYTNSDAWLYLNDTEVATSTSFQTDGSTSNTDSLALRVGTRTTSAGFWPGDIGEIIICGSDIGEILFDRLLEEYLYPKWALPDPEPEPEPEPPSPPEPYEPRFGITPARYMFFDTTPPTNWRASYPDYGPVGSDFWVTWQDVHTASGTFDWSTIDNYLAQNAGMMVTLADGSEVQKPTVLCVRISTSTDGWYGKHGHYFYDYTPEWVYVGGGVGTYINGHYVGYVLDSGGTKAVIPGYELAPWHSAYNALITALGARYESDDRVQAVVMDVGLDGETQIAKTEGAIDWASAAHTAIGGVANYEAHVEDIIAKFRDAFPTKPLFVMNGPGTTGVRRAARDAALAETPKVGLKIAGWTIDYDNTNYECVTDPDPGYDGEFQHIKDNWEDIPVWLETKSALGIDDDAQLWMYYLALNYHPDLVNMHPAWFSTYAPSREFIEWFCSHLGATVTNTPSVWAALGGPPVSYEEDCNYMIQNWYQWLEQKEVSEDGETVRVLRAALPVACQGQAESLEARQTGAGAGDYYMYFYVDQSWPYANLATPGVYYHTVKVTYLDAGTDPLTIEWIDYDGAIQTDFVLRTDTNTFVTHTFTLTDCPMNRTTGSGVNADAAIGIGKADFRLFNGGLGATALTIHFVEVKGYEV